MKPSDSQQNTLRASTTVKRPFLTRPLWYAIGLAAVAGSVGIMVGFEAPKDLQKALFTGSVGLIFGGLLTAVVKLLVEDHERKRGALADQAEFTSNVLSDLKSVYDRVERSRIVIAAHQSTSTYGKEMRDLIDSRVQLRNVIRALAGETRGFGDKRAGWLTTGVEAMEPELCTDSLCECGCVRSGLAVVVRW